MKSKRMLAAVMAAALLMSAGCGKAQEQTQEVPTGTAVEVMTVSSGPMNAEYSVTGKVVTLLYIILSPSL